MNLQTLILHVIFCFTYCQAQKGYQMGSVTVACDKNTSMCNSACKNGECDVDFCYDIDARISIDNIISECKHFRCSGKSKTCYCHAGEICICKTGYAINTKDTKECRPYCAGGCENGWCSAPEVCSCNPGYKLDSENKYKCVSQCSSACTNGNCNKEGKCICRHNYKLRNLTCIINDDTAPKPGSCSSGYALKDNKCKPVCEPKCADNMTCYAPGRCRCIENHIGNNNTSKCELRCRECIDGSKLENGSCVCSKAYTIDPSDPCKCISKCSPPCIGGSCTERGTCTCPSNYKLDKSTNKCEWKCKECTNGRSKDDICSCDKGYKKDPSNNCTCISKCKSNETWNERTSKCELKRDHCIKQICESIAQIHNCKNCSNYMYYNTSIISESYKDENEIITWKRKCTNIINSSCVYCDLNKNIELRDKAICDRYQNTTCECDNFVCDITCNHEERQDLPNNTSMEQSSQIILYIVPVCVILVLILIIIVVIVVQRKHSQNNKKDYPLTNLPQSYDDGEIVENVELYGRF